MLEINGPSFMDAVMEIRRVQDIIDHVGDDKMRHEAIGQVTIERLATEVEKLSVSAQALFARTSLISIQRLRNDIENEAGFTWDNLRHAMADIESRLRDELGLVRLFVLNPDQCRYMMPGKDLMGKTVSARFPSFFFVMEDAAACIALWQYPD